MVDYTWYKDKCPFVEVFAKANFTEYNVTFPLILSTNEDSDLLRMQLVEIYHEYLHFIEGELAKTERHSFSSMPYDTVKKLNKITAYFMGFLEKSCIIKYKPNVVEYREADPRKASPFCALVYTSVIIIMNELLDDLWKNGIERQVIEDEIRPVDTDW